MSHSPNTNASVTGFYDSIASNYDEIVEPSIRVQRIRESIRKKVLADSTRDSNILEIGCGTGTDAIYLAQQGLRVTAIDISSVMIKVAREKSGLLGLDQTLVFKVMDAEKIHFTDQKFDVVFSVFNAVNHIDDIPSFIHTLKDHLNPGAQVHFVLLNTFCPIESWFWSFRFKFFISIKKFFNRKNTFSLPMQMFSSRKAKEVFSPAFHHFNIESFGMFAPPDPFSVKWMEKWDAKFLHSNIFSSICDHYIISMTKK